MSSARDWYYTFDDPVPYKELMIYPIKIRDYFLFSRCASILMLEKNSITDPQLAMKAISMTYLEYLFSVNSQDTSNTILQLFVGLFALILRIDKNDTEFKVEFGTLPDGRPSFKIGGTIYDSSDFDEIKNIIAEQNMLDLPDERIQKNVRDKLEEARRFKEKLSGNKPASFEEQMVALSLYNKVDLEKIYDMTVRKFIMSLRRANHMIMSNIYLTASMSGFVEFKDKSILKTWLVDLNEEDKFGDVKLDPEAVQSKINFEDAKKG